MIETDRSESGPAARTAAGRRVVDRTADTFAAECSVPDSPVPDSPVPDNPVPDSAVPGRWEVSSCTAPAGWMARGRLVTGVIEVPATECTAEGSGHTKAAALWSPRTGYRQA